MNAFLNYRHPSRRQPPLWLLLVAAALVLVYTRSTRHTEGDRPCAPSDDPSPDAMESWTATVVTVADGDTLTLQTEDQRSIRVRLHGIDAPEWQQPGGTAARQALARRTLGRPLTVIPIETDAYGRLVAELYDGTNWINAALVADGWAWHYRHHSRSRRLAAAERAARTRRAGIWRDPHPTPPWNWRRQTERR